MSNLIKPQWKIYTPASRPPPDYNRILDLEKRILGVREFGTTKQRYDTSNFSEFWKIYSFFTRTTDEKQVVYQKLRDEVLDAAWKENGSMVDIGAGTGALSGKIAPNFRNCLLIERNSDNVRILEGFLKLRSRKPDAAPRIVVVNGSFPETKIEGKADFVYMGHMLYFQPRETWMDSIRQAETLVKDGGKLAITMHGDMGQVSGMVELYEGRCDDIKGLAAKCISEFGAERVELHAVSTRHYAASGQGMRAVMGFFMLDTEAKFTEYQMARQINDYLKNGRGFVITKYDKTIVIGK